MELVGGDAWGEWGRFVVVVGLNMWDWLPGLVMNIISVSNCHFVSE